MNILDYKRKALGYTFRGEGGGGEGGGGDTSTDTGVDIGNAAQDSQSSGLGSLGYSETPTADVGSFGPVASVTTESALTGLTPTDVGSFSPVATDQSLASAPTSTSKPGETSMAQTASQTGGTNLSSAALAGTLDAANLTKSDLGALQAMGFGNLQGANKNNPTQSINELYNSYAFNDFLTENMPSPATLASMVAGPVAGIVVNTAISLAQGKSATSVFGNVVGSILGQVISQVTNIPISLDTLTALVDGQVGRAGLSVAFNAIANQTGLPVSAVQAGLSGNLGAAVQNTLTGAITAEAAKTLGANPQFMGEVMAKTGLSTSGLSSFVNQIAAPLNEVTSKISESIGKIGVPTGVNNLAGAISSGAVNTTPVAEGGNQDEYLKQLALNSGLSPAQAQANTTASPPSTGGIKINWNGVFGESSAANNKLPVVSTPPATGTAGTTGAMQGGFGSGTDVEAGLTNAGLVPDMSEEDVAAILGVPTNAALQNYQNQLASLTSEERAILNQAEGGAQVAQALPATVSDAGQVGPTSRVWGSGFAANDPRIQEIYAKNPSLLQAAKQALGERGMTEYFNTYAGSTASNPVYTKLLELALKDSPNDATLNTEYKRLTGDYLPGTMLYNTSRPLSDLPQETLTGFGPVASVIAGDDIQKLEAMISGTMPVDLAYDWNGDDLISPADKTGLIQYQSGNSTFAPATDTVWGTRKATTTPVPIPTPPQLNKQDVAAIVDTALKANPSLTEAQVQKIVTDATAALPTGVTADQAKTIVDTAIKAIPSGLSATDVAKIVTDAFEANPYVNKDQVAGLISDAVGKIPAGMTAADVGKIVNAAVSNIPAGLSTADVAKVVNDAIAKIPAGISTADVSKIVGDAVAAIPAGISRSDVDTIVKDALAANPSLTSAQVTKIVSDQIAKIPAGITKAEVAAQVKDVVGAPATGTQAATGVYAAIANSAKALTDALDAANKGNADAFARVDKAIADLAAAGLTGDDVQSIVDASGVELSKEFSDAIDAASKGNAQALTDLGDSLQKSIDDTTKTLTDAIAANEKAGLTRDEATQKALDDVATQMGVNKQAVLDQLGLTAEGLTKQFEAGLGEVSKQVTETEQRLLDAVQAARDMGLEGDAALQAGLDSVASELGVTKESLLTQIGKTEAGLRQELETGLGTVTKNIEATKKELADAIAANEKSGLSRDQATQKAVTDLAAELGTTKENLLTQLGTTEETLRTQIEESATALGTQLTEQGKQFMDALIAQGMDQKTALDTAIAAQNEQAKANQEATQTALNQLSAAQQKEVADRVAAGQATDAAIAAVQQSVTQGQTALQTQLTAQGKQFMDALVAQGMDQKTALETAINAQNEQAKANQEATQKQISDFDTQLNARIDALTQTGMDQYTATQTAMRDMYTGLTGQIGEAEKQRQADRDAAAAQRVADQEAAAAAAAEAERKRIADVEAQKAQAAANLKTTQVGQLRGQMMTGLQGLIGGMQQQATQMAAPGVVETVKATPGFDFRSPLNVGFFSGYESQKTPPKGQESTKIAEGGYLDDLLDAIR